MKYGRRERERELVILLFYVACESLILQSFFFLDRIFYFLAVEGIGCCIKEYDFCFSFIVSYEVGLNWSV